MNTIKTIVQIVQDNITMCKISKFLVIYQINNRSLPPWRPKAWSDHRQESPLLIKWFIQEPRRAWKGHLSVGGMCVVPPESASMHIGNDQHSFCHILSCLITQWFCPHPFHLSYDSSFVKCNPVGAVVVQFGMKCYYLPLVAIPGVVPSWSHVKIDGIGYAIVQKCFFEISKMGDRGRFNNT